MNAKNILKIKDVMRTIVLRKRPWIVREDEEMDIEAEIPVTPDLKITQLDTERYFDWTDDVYLFVGINDGRTGFVNILCFEEESVR